MKLKKQGGETKAPSVPEGDTRAKQPIQPPTTTLVFVFGFGFPFRGRKGLAHSKITPPKHFKDRLPHLVSPFGGRKGACLFL